MAKKKVKDAPVPEEQTISSYKQRAIKEKVEYTVTPAGYVKCMALVDYSGMTDIIFKGDVILLPERRFKSLAYRGYVCEYSGDIEPIGKR